MALEKRNGNYYYYKKEREGNRVVSRYYGKGELASLVAQMDEIEREEKKIKTLENLRLKQETEAIDREIDLYESEVTDLITKTLLSLGFYKTKSREWRLKAK
ncbi:MAG TPA: hypothetical protein VK308_16895 [Pyrinomonadaceae bacterium]|nr:hypothetical protein [Pyrinomonadaceae bacterium]